MKPEALAKWENTRAKGKARYILITGVLSYGLPMFILMTFIFDRGFSTRIIGISAVIWAVGGALFGAIMWCLLERQYRKATHSNAMDVAVRIKQERGLDTIAGILPSAAAVSATDVAAKFGLSDSSECYEEIDVLEATRVLESVLHRDMAYNFEVMPLHLARELSIQFIAEFPRTSTRFFTNGEFGRPQVARGVLPSWTPATSATFDTGVIVVSDKKIGCVWCLDED